MALARSYRSCVVFSLKVVDFKLTVATQGKFAFKNECGKHMYIHTQTHTHSPYVEKIYIQNKMGNGLHCTLETVRICFTGVTRIAYTQRSE